VCIGAGPAKDELIAVSGKMCLAQAVVDAEGPGFEIGEDAMDPAQDHPGSGQGGCWQEGPQRGSQEIGGRARPMARQRFCSISQADL